MEKVVRKFKKPFLGIVTALLIVSSPLNAFADEAKGTAKKKKKEETKIEMPDLGLESEAAFLYDMNLNKIIYEKNPNKKYPTASLAKVMTLSLASDALKSGKVKATDKVSISTKAWKTGGSRMFLEVGREVPFGEIFKGVAVVSGNDASVAIAEHLEGSTDAFVKKMNKKADELGMKNTEFRSVNGLPDEEVTDLSTAKDLGLMTIDYLKKYSGNLEIHRLKEYSFDTGREVITQKNRNPLLEQYKGADGLKTGFVDDTYNLIGTAQRDGIRLLFVSMKAPNDKARAKDAKKILDYGFKQYGKYELATKGYKAAVVPVYKAKDVRKTDVVFKDDANVVIHSSELNGESIHKEIELPEYINAGKGLKAGEKVGVVKFYGKNKLIHKADLVIAQDIEEGSFLGKFLDSFTLFGNWVLDLFKG